MKLHARGTHPRLGIRNPEDHYLVASQLQGTRQRGHWIQMTGPRKTECSQSRHCYLQSLDFNVTLETTVSACIVIGWSSFGKCCGACRCKSSRPNRTLAHPRVRAALRATLEAPRQSARRAQRFPP